MIVINNMDVILDYLLMIIIMINSN